MKANRAEQAHPVQHEVLQQMVTLLQAENPRLNVIASSAPQE